ncbi:hypothetical protein SOP57_13570 [Enterococcus faecalis]|jgi:hypothetical protein|uniref:hypothetical protein n=1 Tax=Enterococcus TaxID=1350 RepID=UPI0019F26858|nr:hypothetical protein [Enterococcus faecalis]EGO9028835.1 hypothetical protein [Enterococcus faecalis]EME7220452.1 hypothetical protein [Enterococcus faecium]MDY2553551.1 hypothetical protein [Enterococcus faecalis]HDA6121886.1 hypothetical protein [Enterococcus faecium]
MESQNKFAKAKNELEHKQEKVMPNVVPVPKNEEKEIKKTSVFMLTPTDKNNFKKLAKSYGMSMSELLAFWINESIKHFD